MLDQPMLDQIVSPAAAVGFPGLIFAYRFRDGQAEALPAGGLLAALQEPGGWIWIHLALTETHARDWIAHHAPLPERARAILLSDDEHQLLEPIANGVAGVFADLLREGEGEARDLGRLRFALTDTLVVSGRRDALGAIERTLQAIDAGRRFPDAVALLEAIVEHFVDATAALAQQLADTLDLIEDHLIDDAMRDEQRRLGPVRRTAVRLHRQLASLRVLFHRWAHPTAAELPSRIGVAAGRLAQRLDGLDQEVVALQERARLLQEEITAKLAAETNRHLFALSLATVFLLPPTLAAGIFGMNVSDLPFTKEAGGFFWAIALCVASSVAVYDFLRWLRIMR
jgi:Mg2+ and Co2+ transporter CorA